MESLPANQIDYSSLYASNYTGHAPNVASFPPDAVPLLAGLARELGCSHAVDLGSGNGSLGMRLSAENLQTTSLDFREFPEAGVRAFDLTVTDPAAVATLRHNLPCSAQGQPYLTLCLDVLEHFDRSDLPAVLHNLNALTDRFLLCSISTRPSSDFNLYHATVLPTSSWLEFLRLAGFTRVDNPLLQNLRFHHQYPDMRSLWCVHQWRLLDIYRESRNPEPNYLLLEKTSEPLPAATEQIRTLARCRHRHVPVEVAGNLQFTFLLGHVQNFSLYEPFWDVLPKRQVDIIVREGIEQSIEPNRLETVLAWIRCRGIAHKVVHSVDDIPWSHDSQNNRVFLSASESTAADCHLHNLAFVAQARFHGYLTALLQHGIWSEDFGDPIAFLSDVILAWSPEHYECFLKLSSMAPASRPWSRGIVEKSRFHVTGCPKFDPYASRSDAPQIEHLLGDWTRGFQRTVVVTTNLLWGRHQTGRRSVWEHLTQVAEHLPKVLFVLKLHPSEDPDDQLAPLLPPNLVVLSEPMCWCAGIRTSDLIRAADLVATTLSTIALEAALAEKPVYLFNTGVGLEYQHLAAKELDGLEAVIRGNDAVQNSIARDFTNHYYSAETLGNALANSLTVLLKSLERLNPAARMPTSSDVIAMCLGRLASRNSAKLFHQQSKAR